MLAVPAFLDGMQDIGLLARSTDLERHDNYCERTFLEYLKNRSMPARKIIGKVNRKQTMGLHLKPKSVKTVVLY